MVTLDLRHVASPAVRDLLHLVNHPDFDRAQQMVFDCDAYTDGTSGGPFLVHVNPKTGDGWVIGVIGGYQQGGDSPNISYSPRFYSAIWDLYETAVAGSSG